MSALLISLSVVYALLAALFLIEPLVRSEDDVTSLDGAWPGTLFHCDAETERPAERSDSSQWGDERRCQSCGSRVDESFTYCGECLVPVVT